jgi:phage protein U
VTDTESPRPIPLLGDIPLTAVATLRHDVDGRFAAVGVAGLDGEVLQRAGRGGHRIHITGVLLGETVADDLQTLQQAAAAGQELSFAADVTTALDLQAVVISAFRADATAGQPGRFAYELWLAESPPLPPPAAVEGFGGLDDFGLGDLGFDTDLLGDLADLAGDVMAAVDSALDVIGALEALAGLEDLSLDGALAPLEDATAQIADAGRALNDAVGALGEAFGT